MKRIVIALLMLLSILVLAAGAQAPVATDAGAILRPMPYDTFNTPWLDPLKWVVTYPQCWGTLECVREIQNGHLRLAVRNFGATNSDDGVQWSESEVYFPNPNEVESITADVLLRSFSGVDCSTNKTDFTHTQVMIGGNFFNTGSGNTSDDVSGWLILWVDPRAPSTMQVVNWSSLTGWTDVATYPVGTPLLVSFSWDKVNHQFVAVAQVVGKPGTRTLVAVPYYVSDTLPPSAPLKNLNAEAHSLNCTSGRTFAQVEALYDNVRINDPLAPPR